MSRVRPPREPYACECCIRQSQRSFLWRVYEEALRFFDMRSLGAVDIKDMPLDIEVLHSTAAEVKDQLPTPQTAKVQEFRGGIPDNDG